MTTIPVDAPGFIEVAGGQFWISDELRGQVLRIDPVTGGIAGSCPIEDVSFAVAHNGVWCASASDELVVRVDHISD